MIIFFFTKIIRIEMSFWSQFFFLTEMTFWSLKFHIFFMKNGVAVGVIHWTEMPFQSIVFSARTE